MLKQTFSPGFRLSALDVLILIAGMVAAGVVSMAVWWWGFVIAFVVGHFFLFCNVVRLARPLELLWSGIFVMLAVATVTMDIPGWPLTAGLSLIVTAVLVVVEMRGPSYHGVGWQWINPGLPAWWASQ
jgi:hypothetical protein